VYQRLTEELARQRQADMRRLAARHRAGSALHSASTRPVRRTRDASQSLRARTGWWLVGLGLKLAIGPRARAAASPRPAGS
jgi:hypothetical protein